MVTSAAHGSSLLGVKIGAAAEAYAIVMATPDSEPPLQTTLQLPETLDP